MPEREEAVTTAEWRSPDELLPPEDETILMFDAGEFVLGHYMGDYEWLYRGPLRTYETKCAPTFWMRIPPVPR